MMTLYKHYDVVIIGAGLAGLALARQLLLETDKTILILEKQTTLPSKRQKVGESLVQVGGYYFSKVLDLEEHLLCEHFMKYNLRFYWKSATRNNERFEDYSQAYIRSFSNIASYQLDRNKLEGELLRLNSNDSRFTCYTSVRDLDVDLSEEGSHTVSFTTLDEAASAQTLWVVDTTGRSRLLTRRLELAEDNPINHGASFLWVDGLVDIDKLTDLSLKDIRLKKDRAAIGHLPVWLATNHFMGEGFWFWVIPLQGKTSLGLVYDNALISREQVNSPAKLLKWVCKEFPLLERDLPHRTILDYGSLRDFSYDCTQAIHPSRWALSGVSGRFTDPLYSPGSDFIAIHNTLICDAIMTQDGKELARKCHLYELVMHSLYTSLIPTFATSYDALGHQASFVLKYTWELSVYFSFFVFPFINDLITDRQFIVSFLSKFSRLGSINANLQSYLSAYYQWKKTQPQPAHGPLFHDFASLEALCRAESMFYKVGVTVDEARKALDDQLKNLTELAHFIVAYINADVAGAPEALTNRSFVERVNLKDCIFDTEAIREHYAQCAHTSARYTWSFDSCALDKFHI